jgi:hypothetical protein
MFLSGEVSSLKPTLEEWAKGTCLSPLQLTVAGIDVESDRNESEFEYDMPAVEAEVGMIIGFMSEGAAAIGCIVKIEDMLEVDAGVEVMWVFRGQLSKRGRRRAVVGATRVTFSGRGESHERVTGEWRALDVESVEMQKGELTGGLWM